MTTATVQEVQAGLPDLLRRLMPGEELVITDNDRPVAKLVATPPESSQEPRKLGTMRGTVLSMEHFDDPLEEFEEYM